MQFHRIKHSCKYSVCFLSAFCILHSEGSSFPGLMSIIWCELSPCFRLSTIFCVFWTLSNAVPRTLQTICLQNIISWPLDVLFGSSEFSWIKSQLWFGTPFQHAKWEKVTKYILEKMIQKINASKNYKTLSSLLSSQKLKSVLLLVFGNVADPWKLTKKWQIGSEKIFLFI